MRVVALLITSASISDSGIRNRERVRGRFLKDEKYLIRLNAKQFTNELVNVCYGWGALPLCKPTKKESPSGKKGLRSWLRGAQSARGFSSSGGRFAQGSRIIR